MRGREFGKLIASCILAALLFMTDSTAFAQQNGGGQQQTLPQIVGQMAGQMKDSFSDPQAIFQGTMDMGGAIFGNQQNQNQMLNQINQLQNQFGGTFNNAQQIQGAFGSNPDQLMNAATQEIANRLGAAMGGQMQMPTQLMGNMQQIMQGGMGGMGMMGGN